MKGLQVLTSKNSDEWETPNDVFNALDEHFNFTLDVAATKENTKCKKYFTEKDDGISQNWGYNVCWMNPPYSNIKGWMRKAETAYAAGATVVCLVPARTDTAWWHDYAMKATERRFIRGRIAFLKNGVAKNKAPFPACYVIFDNRACTICGINIDEYDSCGCEWSQ